MDIIINILLVLGIVMVTNFVLAMFKIRKLLKLKEQNPNIQGISIVNGEIHIIEKEDKQEVKARAIEWVEDPICHKKLEKKDAYRLVKDGVEYFFCSWDCREAFIKQNK